MVDLGRTGMQWKAGKVSGPDCEKGRPFKSALGRSWRPEGRGERPGPDDHHQENRKCIL